MPCRCMECFGLVNPPPHPKRVWPEVCHGYVNGCVGEQCACIKRAQLAQRAAEYEQRLLVASAKPYVSPVVRGDLMGRRGRLETLRIRAAWREAA